MTITKLQNKLGSGIPVWSDLTISDGLKYISGSYKIAMVYSGDSAPMLVCEALISTPTLKSGNRPYSMNIK